MQYSRYIYEAAMLGEKTKGLFVYFLFVMAYKEILGLNIEPFRSNGLLWKK